MSFFGVGGNPFATQIGMKIERATMETLPSEDWSLNMEICDVINNTEEGPRDAMKAIRKRLSIQPKNYTIVMYSLTVLETCVKNCGRRFHVLVCSKDFVQELVKLIGPKNDPPAAVQEKVLCLIQSWADAFRHQPDLAGVSQVYADLKHKGVEFPPADPENNIPILTPQRSSSVSPTRHRPPNTYNTESQQTVTDGGPSALTPEQKAKLVSELELVESNTKILAEMLNELSPGKEEPDDLQLLKDLHATCRAMQERVVELVGRINDDLLIADILRINDDLNNIFVRYERHMSKHRPVVGGANESSPVEGSCHIGASIQSPPQNPNDAPLIDLGEEPKQVQQQLASLSIGKKIDDVDFDAFAQSRTSGDGAKASDTNEAIPKDQRLSDFDEMEKWLQENPASANGGATSKPRVTQDSVSASEFDRFLAERAAAADSLPTISAATGSSSLDQPRTRTLAKEDEKEKQLFSL